MPGTLGIGRDGEMPGRTSDHEKRLGDMRGVYRDEDAFGSAIAEYGEDHLVYRVEEHRNVDGPGGLIIGTSALLPARHAATAAESPDSLLGAGTLITAEMVAAAAAAGARAVTSLRRDPEGVVA